MLTIGLTGGIGTGKSEVARVLAALGAVVVNADQIGHQVYEPHTEGWRDVVATFGEGVLAASGEVDRKKLGALVFNDAKALAQLNRITHPRIFSTIRERLAALRAQGTRVAVVEAALLLEAGWRSLVDEVWVVDAPEDVVVQRVHARSGLPHDQVRRRIRAQMPPHQRRAHADVVIENNGTLEELQERVRTVWNTRVLPRI